MPIGANGQPDRVTNSVDSVTSLFSGTPVYMQVAAGLRARIEGGEFAPGQDLPAEADLASYYGVGKNALRDALAVLREEGLISTKRGYRARVREMPPREILPAIPGSRISAHRATSAERGDERLKHLHLQPGDWVYEVDGVLYRADSYEWQVPPEE